MAWRDDLRAASFRGATFYVNSAELTAGRRLARHEYPQRDIPFLEDMGRRAREYSIEAFVLGSDYMRARDALLEAIEAPGAGQLVHPWHGTVNVTVAAASLNESTERGGMAVFSLTFVEAGQQTEPRQRPDTDAAMQAAGAAVESAAIADFSRLFSVDKFPEFVRKDAVSAMGEILAAPGLIASAAQSTLSALVAMPGKLGAALVNMVKTSMGYAALLDYKIDISEPRYYTPARQQITTNRNAIRDVVQAAATARRTMELASAPVLTIDDARAARREIVDYVDSIILSPTVEPATADALVQLRTYAITHFFEQTPYLPRIARITRNISLPSVVIAHEFYGRNWLEEGREIEIIKRNNIRHPGFAPAGQALEMVA